MRDVKLNLDRETAHDLYALLYAYGEHIAAGASFPDLSPEVEKRLTAVFRDLESQLGFESMAAAMQRALAARNQGQG